VFRGARRHDRRPSGQSRLVAAAPSPVRPIRARKRAFAAVKPLISEPIEADRWCMERLNNDLPRNAALPEADMAVAVAERGLDAWRAAKAAWLDSFAVFVAQEAASPSGTSGLTQHLR
jgi:hypothetical protein